MADGARVFRGTASWYARFRRDYPPHVIELIQNQAGLSQSSRVLDLGCGTGQIALALAPLVGSVTGVDIDPDMLSEAAAAADRRRLSNCEWVLSAAEAFPHGPCEYDLVVIASAFHWMDRRAVTCAVYESLVPQGLFAVLGSPAPLDQVQRREGMGRVIAEVQDRWFEPTDFPTATADHVRHETLIGDGPFGEAQVTYHPTAQEWDVDSFLGFMLSTSLRPDQVLGDRFDAFAEDLRTAILSVQPDGRWIVENRIEVILARKH